MSVTPQQSQMPIVISGPSGTGKSTLLEKLFAKYPDRFAFCVSHTTRQPRPGETPGKSYHYISRDEFTTMIAENKFIEYAEFSGNLYGTSFQSLTSLPSAQVPILDLELNGVKSLKSASPTLQQTPLFIFISPPSLESLKHRLEGRKTETEESLKKRLDSAHEAMEYAKGDGVYDRIIVNEDAEKAFGELCNCLKEWDVIPKEMDKVAKVEQVGHARCLDKGCLIQ